MPMFNENNFVFDVSHEQYVDGPLEIEYDIAINQNVIGKHTLDITRSLQQLFNTGDDAKRRTHEFK